MAPAGAAKAAPKAVAVNSEPLRYRMTQEDAESQAQNVLPPEVIADLPSSNWKSRLAAMEALQSWVEGQMESLEPELVVRVFSKTPGWKESNFQVYSTFSANGITISWSLFL